MQYIKALTKLNFNISIRDLAINSITDLRALNLTYLTKLQDL